MSVRELARKVGVSPTFISNVKKGTKHADLPKAVAIEKATGGKIKVEEIVRPEVASALRKYLSMRCMSKKSSNGEEKESLRSQEG